MSASDVIGQGVIEVRLDTSHLAREQRDVEQSMSRSMRQVGKRMQDTGRTLTRRLTLPLVGLGTAILRTAGDFESSMNRVGAITNATGDDFDSLRSLAMELGRTTQFSASQAAEGMGFLAMAGFEVHEILDAMPGVLQLAAAGQLDLARAADITSNVLQGFGLAASDVGRVNDVLAATASNANTDINQLADALSYAAPIATAAGWSLEDVAAAVGGLSDAGIQGSRAGTTLVAAIAALESQSGPARQRLEELGVATHDAAGELLPLADIVEQLERKGLSAGDALEIFGRRGGPGMAALISTGADALRDMSDTLENAGGTAERMADRQMEGLNGALLRMKSAAEGAAIAIGDSGLLEGAANFAETVADWFSALAEVNPALLNTIVIVGGLAAAVGPATWAVGGMIRGFGALIGALNPVTLAIGVAVLALGAFIQSKANARARVEELRSTLDEHTGAITDNTNALVMNRLQQDGLIDAARVLGINMETLRDAALGEADAMRTVEAAMLAGAEAHFEGAEGGAAMLNAAHELSRGLNGLTGELGEAQGKQRQLAEATAETEGKFLDAAHAAEHGYSNAMFNVSAATSEGGLAMGNAGDEASGLEGNLYDAAGAMEDFEDATEEATNAIRAYADEVRAQNDPLFALHRALGDVEAAQEAFNEAVKEHGPNSREARDASVRLADSALGLAGAAGDASGAFTGQLDPALRDIMRSAGFTEDQIDAVEGSFRDAAAAGAAFEDDYQARVGLSNDRWTIQRLNLINQIADRTARDRSFRVTPYLDASSYNRALGRINTGQPLASGGTAHAGQLHLVGEEGPEFFVPNVTGTVIDAERTARLMLQGPDLSLGGATPMTQPSGGAAGAESVGGSRVTNIYAPTTSAQDLIEADRRREWLDSRTMP